MSPHASQVSPQECFNAPPRSFERPHRFLTFHERRSYFYGRATLSAADCLACLTSLGQAADLLVNLKFCGVKLAYAPLIHQ